MYKKAMPNPNKNLQYFEGPAFSRISSLRKKNGKFNNSPKLDNIFIDLNRQLVENPPPKYVLPSSFNRASKKKEVKLNT
jgi:hypothetical protein